MRNFRIKEQNYDFFRKIDVSIKYYFFRMKNAFILKYGLNEKNVYFGKNSLKYSKEKIENLFKEFDDINVYISGNGLLSFEPQIFEKLIEN